ncbi:phosphate ABC transporter permease subunit PstC [Candidatus Methylobacter favarea]|nr:phosphate ABC transporter permease subunit PstC [Candidatus Methylobacter favarea]
MSAWSNRIGRAYILISTLISAIIILLIALVLFIYSWEAISQQRADLFTSIWNPAAGQFGILAMLYGSLMVTVIALAIAIPLGLATALFTSEMLGVRYRFHVKFLLELLAGIPSVLYGLIGVAFFSVWLGDLFDLQSGRTILTAGILLAIMVLPTIITLGDDALHNVPRQYREAAQGLGLYPHEVIIHIVLPLAKTDIAGAVLLALGRALGETMAVMLVIGGIDKIPPSLVNIMVPGQTITSKLGREIEETAFASMHFSALIFMGLALLVMVLALTAIAQHYFRPGLRLYE